MAIRKILYVIAVLVVLLGASQLVFTSWWLDRMPGLIDSPRLYLWGLPGILLGVVLLIGVLERAVGLRLFLTLLAILSISLGGLGLVQPDLVRDFAHSFLLDRSHTAQVVGVWASGIVRMAIGIALLYALIRPTRAAEPVSAAPEPPPSDYPMEQ